MGAPRMRAGASLFMGMDADGLDRLTRFLDQTAPKEATRELGRCFARVGTKVAGRVKSRGYTEAGGSSVGIGPGKNHGHLSGQLKRRAGAIGFGGYARVNFNRDGAFKARWHEFGTADRYVKSYHRGRYRSWGWKATNDSSVLARGSAFTLREKRRLAKGLGYRGRLSARAPMLTAWEGVDQSWINAELGKAVIRALKVKE